MGKKAFWPFVIAGTLGYFNSLLPEGVEPPKEYSIIRKEGFMPTDINTIESYADTTTYESLVWSANGWFDPYVKRTINFENGSKVVVPYSLVSSGWQRNTPKIGEKYTIKGDRLQEVK